MVKEAIGIFRRAPRSRTGIIYVPTLLVMDSAWPFNDKARIVIRIDGKRLIVEEAKE